MDSEHAIPFMNCMETGSKELFRHIPAEANVPIPVSPDHMNSMMHGGHSSTGMTPSVFVCCIPPIQTFSVVIYFFIYSSIVLLTSVHNLLKVLFGVVIKPLPVFSRRKTKNLGCWRAILVHLVYYIFFNPEMPPWATV